MRTTFAPLHLLLSLNPLADHLIDRRLDECRGDGFALAKLLPVVGNEHFVVADLGVEFSNFSPE